MTLVVHWHGTKAKAAARKGAARGLMRSAEHVLQQANLIVPIEESTLLKSGVAHAPDRAMLRAAVSYDTPYAVRQHEELTYRHDPGRQAKYLETPLNVAKADGTVNRLIAEEIKQELGD